MRNRVRIPKSLFRHIWNAAGDRIEQSFEFNDSPDYQGDHVTDEFWGVACEYALAYRLGVLDRWAPTLNTFKEEPDVMEYDVRMTKLSTGALEIREGDLEYPDRKHVLVYTNRNVKDLVFDIQGWAYNREAMNYQPNSRGKRYIPFSRLGELP